MFTGIGWMLEKAATLGFATSLRITCNRTRGCRQIFKNKAKRSFRINKTIKK